MQPFTYVKARTAADAVRAAKSYITMAIAGAAGWRLGTGHGPVDHFGWEAKA